MILSRLCDSITEMWYFFKKVSARVALIRTLQINTIVVSLKNRSIPSVWPSKTSIVPHKRELPLTVLAQNLEVIGKTAVTQVAC